MLYALVKDGPKSEVLEFPIRAGQLGTLLNMSLPANEEAIEKMDLTPFNIFPVPNAKQPDPSAPFMRVALDTPKWKGDALVRTFKEIRRTPAEIADGWERLRADRDKRLAATDWSQSVSDIDPERKAAYAAYRAALKNLPASTEDPFQATWPEKPA